ncbi:MAG TPA: 2-phospho-L-lactate transferase [Caulobacteraceae bacterium]|nr:2-phospho-L-lactate transferase [Caulobacteraceae bacterium]
MRVTVLTGGVGGAKLVLGLTNILPADQITAIVNTGDDCVHLGLPVSPDIDTLLYTLSGRFDEERGWGRIGETWSFMAAVRELGGPDWFNLGDGDLALHVTRLAALARGDSLSQVTAAFARAFGLAATILPMSDDRIATVIDTDEGRLSFQEYFVARKCAPTLRRVSFADADSAKPGPGVLDAIAGADRILIAPSNPWLSVDPILAVPGLRNALVTARSPVVAVSPLIAGRAVKGPTAKLMAELGLPLTNASIADHYTGLIDGLLIDSGDGAEGVSMPVERTATLMRSLDDRKRVARAALDLAGALAT